MLVYGHIFSIIILVFISIASTKDVPRPKDIMLKSCESFYSSVLLKMMIMLLITSCIRLT